jgi:hypothetical protein
MEAMHEFMTTGGMGRMVKYTSGPKKGKTEYRPYTHNKNLKQRKSICRQ